MTNDTRLITLGREELTEVGRALVLEELNRVGHDDGDRARSVRVIIHQVEHYQRNDYGNPVSLNGEVATEWRSLFPDATQT